MNKTHWKKAFNKDYLGSHDLDEGQELKATIQQVEVKDVVNPQGSKEPCNVAHFTDHKIKPMILNTTACKLIKRFTGSNYIEDWRNVDIQIYVTQVKAFGEVVDALRIRDKQPVMQKPVLSPAHEKWNDAVKAYQEAADKDKKLKQMKKYYEVPAETVEALNAA